VISAWPALWAARWATASASATFVVGFSSMGDSPGGGWVGVPWWQPGQS
jgi:hypothetical protein